MIGCYELAAERQHGRVTARHDVDRAALVAAGQIGADRFGGGS